MKKLAVVVIILGVLAFGTSQAYGWWDQQINTPMSTRSVKVDFKVAPGEGASEVADGLQAKGLIRDSNAFMLYLKITGRTSSIQAGDFALDKQMSVPEIVDALSHGRFNQVIARMPDSIPTRFAAPTVASGGAFTADDYLKAVNDPAWKQQYDFLSGIPSDRNPLLEGYLTPETYYLDPGQTAHDLVKKQLDAFAQVMTPALRQAIAQKTQARPAETIDAVVILASIVDREVNREADKGPACEVFYNRLANGIPLGSDVTVEYALGKLNQPLTQADLQVSSPYNTRIHPGLPPGPIGNPTPSAIQACVNPPNTDDLYFFVDKAGVTHFEKTDAEFQSDIQKYGLSGD